LRIGPIIGHLFYATWGSITKTNKIWKAYLLGGMKPRSLWRVQK
jgi:hypothetical protein